MPIYEYLCKKCGKQFEAFQGITEPELKACKFCKGKVSKLVSLSSFSLKGSGWYVTDYAGKKATTCATETETEKPKAVSDSVSATEAKSDTGRED